MGYLSVNQYDICTIRRAQPMDNSLLFRYQPVSVNITLMEYWGDTTGGIKEGSQIIIVGITRYLFYGWT